MKNLLKDLCKKHPSYQQFLSYYADNPIQNIFFQNILSTPLAILLANLFEEKEKNMLIVAENYNAAINLLNNMENFLQDKQVYFFPTSSKSSTYFEKKDSSRMVFRYNCLQHLVTSTTPCIIISYPEAIVEKITTKNNFIKNKITIKKGKIYERNKLTSFLHSQNFEQVNFVEKPGQFSIRGNIFDVFSFTDFHPFRIDYFGDEVNSIRSFNIETQLSIKKLHSCTLFVQYYSKKNDAEVFLIEYFQQNSILCKYQPLSFFANSDNKCKSNSKILSNKFFNKIINWGLLDNSTTYQKVFNFHQKSPFTLNKNFQLLAEILKTNTENRYKNFICSDNPIQLKRIKHILNNISTTVSFTPINYHLQEGFLDDGLKICCFTEHQIFKRYHKPQLKSFRSKRAQQNTQVRKLIELQSGDYVVHIDYGIGRFEGLQKIDNNGKLQEAICISYQNNDLLYVNSHSLYKISKYKSKEGITPKLNKLGAVSWVRLKQKVKSKVKNIAKDLIQLYAKRKSTKGFAFSADSYLQEELEASFMYEDTPDQTKATKYVKKDMELSFPMDRLLCGDVGFGKTEIAIRAAFKAVSDNKQVAILVPTTLLAFQHYNTFTKRLKNFPCSIDYLCRFRSKNEQNQIIQKLANGQIDIIIGTHRLISRDVRIKDLGLLVVDEEQKFGVVLKEKLRQLKATIDTLTLTATPIPRTLQFSLIGARDLSIMQTPPKNRYPIHTEIHNFKEDVILTAIQKEIDRGGQVFFIHNRIKNIFSIKETLQRIIPNITTEVVHGQMPGIELEKIMLAFMEGRVDVLISTSIIETGLDIPNANTIIINDAHHFGLSDLYQLKGRVGRSTVHAFCYLLIPPAQFLTKQAKERLKAIEEFSDLGSGFNISMKDLDIRGMGNLLGSEQSGFIIDIGYETYQKILNEALHEIRMNEFKDIFSQKNIPEDYVSDCQIKTDFEIYIPDNYIEDVSERITTYRQINNLQNLQQIEEFKIKLNDRFGEIPNAVDTLLNVVRLRWAAIKVGFEQIIIQNNKLIAYFPLSKEHPYFQSKTFGHILSFIQKQVYVSKLQEKGDRLSLSIEGVDSVNSALDCVKSILNQEKFTECKM